jgi:hypothetical protein
VEKVAQIPVAKSPYFLKFPSRHLVFYAANPKISTRKKFKMPFVVPNLSCRWQLRPMKKPETFLIWRHNYSKYVEACLWGNRLKTTGNQSHANRGTHCQKKVWTSRTRLYNHSMELDVLNNLVSYSDYLFIGCDLRICIKQQANCRWGGGQLT